jgi:hypothetical protein
MVGWRESSMVKGMWSERRYVAWRWEIADTRPGEERIKSMVED